MSHRKIEIVRAVWGIAGMSAPGRVLSTVGGDPDDRPSRVVMRILGARQLSQAALSGLSPTPAVLAMGVWVDAVHALSALGLAVGRPAYARPAFADAAIASVWAGFGYEDLRSGGRSEGEELRSRLGRAVLSVVPGGNPLLRRANAARPGPSPQLGISRTDGKRNS